MPRLLIVLMPLIALALDFAACDSDGTSTSPTPAPTPTEIPSSTVSRVKRVDDVSEFLDQFADEQVIERRCALNAKENKVDCGEDGLYRPKPAPTEAADCDLLLIDEEPIAVTCTVQEPLTVTYYEVP